MATTNVEDQLAEINRKLDLVVQLIKVGLGNVNLLTVALQQLKSATDFLKDMQPVTRDLHQQAIAQSIRR